LYEGLRGERLPMPERKAAKEIRIAINTFRQDEVGEDQQKLYDSLLGGLQKDGGRIGRVCQEYTPYQGEIMQYRVRHDLDQYLAESAASCRSLQAVLDYYKRDMETYAPYGVRWLQEAQELASGRCDEPEYLAALQAQKEMRAQLLEQLSEYDACLMTGPTNIMHFTQLPSVTIPIGMGKDGTPRGMILYGAEEKRLFAAARVLQDYAEPVLIPEGV